MALRCGNYFLGSKFCEFTSISTDFKSVSDSEVFKAFVSPLVAIKHRSKWCFFVFEPIFLNDALPLSLYESLKDVNKI